MMKNLTAYFNESLLDDEDDVIVRDADNAETVGKKKQILDWLKTHHGYVSRFTDDIEDHINISRDGDVDTDKSNIIRGNFDIKLGKNETSIPDFMKFKNLSLLRVVTEAKAIDLSNFGNVENVNIKGQNLISVNGNKNTNIEFLKISATNVKSIDLEKIEVERVEAHCPNIILDKIKLSKNTLVCWLPKTVITDMIPIWDKIKWMGPKGR